MDMIDYRAVRGLVRLEEVLDLLGYRYTSRHGHKVRGPCPLRCSISPRACSLDLQRHIWHCFRCEAGGNALDLFGKVEGMPLAEATERLCRLLGLTVPRREQGGQKRSDRKRFRR